MNTITRNRDLPGPLATTEWLATRLEDPGLRVLDCSVVMDFREDGSYFFSSGREGWAAGHVPGSQFADVLTELSDPADPLALMMPPMEDFAAAMAAYGVGRGTRVVCYDNGSHAWAARVWWMLRTAGFDAAAVLDGGWEKWRAEGRAVSTEPAEYPRGDFTAHPRPELMATKQQVLASLHEEGVCIVNALSPESFSGEVQLFPRPGRIPGSTNVYCQALVSPDDHAFIAKERIAEMFRAAGALDAERVIVYCGGGIAASSDALALTLLGHENVSVYDGSMSEWTADPDMPLERD